MSNDTNQRPLRFLHIGDLHITEAGLQNHLDLRRIVDEVNANVSGGIDFVILPGDNVPAITTSSRSRSTISMPVSRLAGCPM